MAFLPISSSSKRTTPNDPYSAMAYQADRGLDAARANASGQAAASANAALGQAYQSLYSQPGQFASSIANIYGANAGSNASGYGSYASGLGQLGNAQSGLYQGYMQGASNILSNKMGAMGMAEAARQAGLANVGAAGLSSYGQLASALAGGLAATNSAGLRGLADMEVANQGALSQYGIGRENALAGTANAAANAGGALGAAHANMAGQTAAARSNAGSSLGQSYGSTIGALGNAAAGLQSQLGNAAGNIAGGAANAYGNMYGNLGNASSNLGSNLAKNSLAAYLGTGQLGVSSNAVNGMFGPGGMSALGGMLGGIGSAFGGGGAQPGGGVSLSAGGSPMGTSYANGSFGASPYAMSVGGGSGGGGSAGMPWSMPDYGQFGVQRQADAAMSQLDRMASSGGGGIGGAVGAGMGTMANLSDTGMKFLSDLRGDTNSNFRSLRNQTFDNIDKSEATGYRGIQDAQRSTFGSINSSRNDIANSPILQSLLASANIGRQNYGNTIQGMTSAMNGMQGSNQQALAGALSGAYGAANSGMGQFYGAMDNINTDDLKSALRSGAGDLQRTGSLMSSGYGNFRNDNRYGFDAANSAIAGLWDKSLGQVEVFKSPLQKAQDAEAARQFDRQTKAQIDLEQRQDRDAANARALAELGPSRDAYIQRRLAELELLKRGTSLSGAKYGNDPTTRRMIDPNWVAQNAGLEWDRRKLATTPGFSPTIRHVIPSQT